MDAREIVLAYLKKHRELNSVDAYNILGVPRLSRVICEIREKYGETIRITNRRIAKKNEEGKMCIVNSYELEF